MADLARGDQEEARGCQLLSAEACDRSGSDKGVDMTVMHRSAVSIAEAIRSGEILAEDVVGEAIRRADVAEPLGALVGRNDEQALERARMIDAAVRRGDPVGPFPGVPIPVKELTFAAGQPCTFGSLGVSDAPR